MTMLMQILLLLLLSKGRSLHATELDKVLLAYYIFKLRPLRVELVSLCWFIVTFISHQRSLSVNKF